MLTQLRKLLKQLQVRRGPTPAPVIDTWEQRVAREQLIDAYLDARIALIPSHLRTTLRAATAGLQDAPITRQKVLGAISRHAARIQFAIDRGGMNPTEAEQRYFNELEELSRAVQSRFPEH